MSKCIQALQAALALWTMHEPPLKVLLWESSCSDLCEHLSHDSEHYEGTGACVHSPNIAPSCQRGPMHGRWLNTHNRILAIPEFCSAPGDQAALCIIQLIPSRPPFEIDYQWCQTEETQAQRVKCPRLHSEQCPKLGKFQGSLALVSVLLTTSCLPAGWPSLPGWS